MVQVDGSHHDWFEGRGPECVFMGYIDDATGKPFGRFYPYEGTLPAMDSFVRYAKKYGIPVSIYLDKHPTYKSTKKPAIEDELKNTEPLSQFARAVAELGVDVIYAGSPQAKGRIERLFNTFQNRLIKEMRLKGVKTIEEANKFLAVYLPVYSKRFSINPANDTDLHRAIPQGTDFNKIFCVKTNRALRNDFTIAHEGKLYQVEDNVRAKEATVEERINGSMLITHKGLNLRFKEIATRPKKEVEIKKEYPLMIRPRGIHIPPKDHPWKKFRLPGSVRIEEKEEIFAGAL
jgi:hypothetical protein